MTDYPVIFSDEENGRCSVFAPDLPGCISWGANRDEARDHIREAIEGWIESAKSDGDLIPKPGSTLEIISIAS